LYFVWKMKNSIFSFRIIVILFSCSVCSDFYFLFFAFCFDWKLSSSLQTCIVILLTFTFWKVLSKSYHQTKKEWEQQNIDSWLLNNSKSVTFSFSQIVKTFSQLCWTFTVSFELKIFNFRVYAILRSLVLPQQ
jgi:hypothetical protein